jgi:anthranilate synthase
VHLEGGIAHYRAGATLVWDSVGAEEDAETRTTATTLFRIIAEGRPAAAAPARAKVGAGKRVLLVDNEDSFVNTLADYFRQTGAEVTTRRHGLAVERIAALAPDLVLHSPGPARPEDFGVPALVRALAERGIPQFGVCLGLQGMVEAFGGSLVVMAQPRHGKTWAIHHEERGLFAGLPSPATVGAYHSLTARLEDFPAAELDVVARTTEGLVMAIRHRRLPIAAVQFHPESILSFAGGFGHRLIDNAITELVTGARAAAAE